MTKVMGKTALILALLSPALLAEDQGPLLGGTLLDVIHKGGFVMVLILLGSVAGLAVALERMVSLRRSNLLPAELKQVIEQGASRRDWTGVEGAVKNESGPLARIIKEGLQRLTHGADEVERAMETTGGHEVARLKRPVRPLAVLATIMPLLGLLGTIFGMIATFNMLGDTSPADRVQKLAPGIGQALYTTAAGLCVAIPFVVIHHILIGRVNRAAEQWSILGSTIVLALKDGSSGRSKAT